MGKALKINRLTRSIFQAPGHRAAFDDQSGKLACSCLQFKVYATCEMEQHVRKLIEKEGHKVVKTRAKKLTFITEKDRFAKTLREILNEKPKSKRVTGKRR